MNRIAEMHYFEVHSKMAPFIDDQNSKEMKAMKLGCCHADFNACEAIATYNVLTHIRMQYPCFQISFSEVIYAYEKKGLMLNGIFGVDPTAIYRYLKTYENLNINMIKGDDYKIFSYDETPKACILTSFNDKKSVTAGVHTISILQNYDGKYFMLNTMSVSSKKYYDNLRDAVIAYLGTESKIICLIMIDMQ